MKDKSLLEAKQILQNAHNILITSHIRPDGDAVGSLLAIGLALLDADKTVQMVLEDGVPKSFRHLRGSDLIKKRPEGEFDAIVVVDCSDLDRTGKVLRKFPTPDISIDHHITNLDFARVNLVDTAAPATAEMLAAYIPAFGLKITRSIAEALLTGLITDTIGFRTTSMRSNALRTAADLMDLGPNLPDLYQKALISRSFEAARYWGAGLNTLEHDNRMVWATLDLEARKSTNYPGSDDADLVNILTTIKNTDIAVIFIEQHKDRVKVSWRARSGFDVSSVAMQFGGGGHKPAAGATIEGNLFDVKADVLKATKKLLNGN
ncbi:MAG: bifunctional oligoribonuclease/PAP phosphatase NrnA [Anaerolineales bacterium]|nr:bifunctional oligoribonuclease/PAP phosphatase NrnA [Chloroflexota bacterium]MBL6980780.1 bifunctional oligoribonuclease/PAP phosphatase NrnA [Anaerolineales bacterium]